MTEELVELDQLVWGDVEVEGDAVEGVLGPHLRQIAVPCRQTTAAAAAAAGVAPARATHNELRGPRGRPPLLPLGRVRTFRDASCQRERM